LLGDMMKDRAQTSLEYLLILVIGVVLAATIAFIIKVAARNAIPQNEGSSISKIKE